MGRMPKIIRTWRIGAMLCLLGPLHAFGQATVTNTATLNFTDPSSNPGSVNSNTVTSTVSPNPTNSIISFFNFSPVPATEADQADGGQCRVGGVFVPIPGLTTHLGAPINTAAPVDLLSAKAFHAGEAIFIKVDDGDKNINTGVRDTVDLSVTTSTGDSEIVRLQETGVNTGIFVSAIQSTAGAPTAFDCTLSAAIDSRITISYVDPVFPSDNKTLDILVDPYGILFDSTSGVPIDGAVISITDSGGGAITVKADDGVTNYPSTLTTGCRAATGCTVTNGVTNFADMPPGGYRFPLLSPGTYKLTVTSIPITHTWPSTVPLAILQTILDGLGFPYAVNTGYDGATFQVLAGPAINIDTPADAISSSLVLSKTASKSNVTTGDFLRYSLTLRNASAGVATSVTLLDTLPLGFRYKSGSLRVNGVPFGDPVIASDGRNLSIALGDIPATTTKELSYVTEITAGAQIGRATNTAYATRLIGSNSNQAEYTVDVQTPFFDSHAILMGRLVQGECDAEGKEIKGIANARVLMEDGTYVLSDKEGNFHFEKVKPGTHVVRVDTGTIPSNLEAVSCEENTRHAGRANSQFVDVQGGTLWRTDFFFREKSVPKRALSIKFTGETVRVEKSEVSEMRYNFEMTAHRNLSDMKFVFTLPDGLNYVEDSAEWRGNTVKGNVEGNKLVFTLPRLGEDHEGSLMFTAIPDTDLAITQKKCFDDTFMTPVEASYDIEGFEGRVALRTQTPTCNRLETKVVEGGLQFDSAESVNNLVVKDDMAAAGGERNWLEGQAAGVEMLFPEEGMNARIPATKIAIKHGNKDIVELSVNGELIDKGFLMKKYRNPDKSVVVSEWRGVHIKEGDNLVEAVVRDGVTGQEKKLSRTLHYSNTLENVEYVPEQSILVANGIDKPRIAIRVLDKTNKPVRKGAAGTYTLQSPYVSALLDEMLDKRQLSGLEQFRPTYNIVTDDGMAFIELRPTNAAGEVTVTLDLRDGQTKDIKVWLEPEAKEWVVVGFAEGTAGYQTLKGNMQALPSGVKDKELDTDGQTKLYAKGMIDEKWIMTVALDTEKDRLKEKERNFKAINNPGEFYTLYADETHQQSDAASSDKIYFKIERSKFYAMFGDYDTGLNDNKLSKYTRSLTGVKSEYSSKFLGFKVFGAKDESSHNREEIQGRGDSLMYRLSRGNILINSEKIVLQLRSAANSGVIEKETPLSRLVDYDLDYKDGILRFKSAIQSQDALGRKQFIVVDYETMNLSNSDYTYGGRAEGRLLKDKLKVGGTYINEDNGFEHARLSGSDVSVQIAENTKVKTEAARTETHAQGQTLRGNAYGAEFEHNGKLFDFSANATKNEANFGIGQDAISERGSFKAGARTTYHFNDKWDFKGDYQHQKQIASDATRDVDNAVVRYHVGSDSIEVGYQRIDEQRGIDSAEADEAKVTVTKGLFKGKLELSASAEENLGPKEKQSSDYPNRYRLMGTYALTPMTKVFVSQEFAQGRYEDTSSTRAGFESVPWGGAKLTQTINQDISESGPRTYSTMGIAQKVLVGERWSFDASLDASKTLRENQTNTTPINPNHPFQSGGYLGDNSFSEDYVAISGGVTYRAEPYTWNLKLEERSADTENKYGLVTSLIRQLSKGIIMSGTLEYFNSQYSAGSNGRLIQGDVSIAARPPESKWTLLDKLKFRFESVDNAASEPIFGQNTISAVNDASSRALINNFNFNLLSQYRRNQASLFYGAKYAWDTYDGTTYHSFTDLWGLEVRQDLSPKWDLGLQGSFLHSWNAKNFKYSFGPSVGWSPLSNSWISVGYNFKGFEDRDFEAARYTQQGVYLKLRVKFDEKTLGLNKDKDEAKPAQ
jgi:uncharacterized repeat protein (TIGR01451 family)